MVSYREKRFSIAHLIGSVVRYRPLVASAGLGFPCGVRSSSHSTRYYCYHSLLLLPQGKTHGRRPERCIKNLVMKLGKEKCPCGSSLYLVIHSHYTKKDGTVVTRYRCRECNRKRMQRYWSTEQGREKAKESNKRSYYKYREKALARNSFHYFLRKVGIQKTSCHCGNVDVEAHHPDYSKPLEVIWLCRSCYVEIHRKAKLSGLTPNI